jgi:integrase
LGERLIALATITEVHDPRAAAVQYRDGLQIAPLALRPLRVSSTGMPQTRDVFLVRWRKLMRGHFGVAFGPHAVRDIAATTVARLVPREISAVSEILGHIDPTTAERHYNRAGSIDAGRRLAALVKRTRRG